MDLQSMFDRMVDMTELICQKLVPHQTAMTIFDTSGIEAWGLKIALNMQKNVLLNS